MNHYLKNLVPVSILLLAVSCSGSGDESDAYGHFEATDVLVSSEVSGKILSLDLEEGQVLEAGKIVGIVDTQQLVLKMDLLQAQIDAVKTKSGNISAQVDVQNETRKTLETEKARLENLLKDGAATQKQMDDINGRIAVINSQIRSIETQNASVSGEVAALEKQKDQVRDQINRSYITNPICGTVLEKYAEVSELAVPGKNLYKIASLDDLYLRVYFSGDQLSSVKIGQQVTVLVDGAGGEMKEYSGVVSWISAQAEFTPKVIQTREERVNLVYAAKIKVKNDGSLKIGMPGEVRLK